MQRSEIDDFGIISLAHHSIASNTITAKPRGNGVAIRTFTEVRPTVARQLPDKLENAPESRKSILLPRFCTTFASSLRRISKRSHVIALVMNVYIQSNRCRNFVAPAYSL